MSREFQYIKPTETFQISILFGTYCIFKQRRLSRVNVNVQPCLSFRCLHQTRKNIVKLGICRNLKQTKAQSSLCQSTVSPMISLLTSDEKNMKICYFSNFKAKSKLRQCRDSSGLSLIAEMRNNMECYFSNFEAQPSL